ncbi:hypothetical protein [Shinella sp. NM-101]|uniref:hypothetical protein n=1 Tax=Shinella sp. NM-101 TaxID=2744455 RepID=UPI001F32EB5F|nr:hypothetical protein [Shinella sp. NM-101]
MGKKAIIETILRPLGLGVYRLRTSSYEKNFLDAALAYKRLLVRDILKKTGYRVARGPFEGLWLPEEGAWSDYDVLAKIVGSYEAEIFFALEEEVARKPSIIVNIGASEGYYAIGMKRRLPEARVYTYDIDVKSFKSLDHCARLNEVEITRLDRFDYANPLAGIADVAPVKPLFILDCEGFEQYVVEMPRGVSAVSSFIIELHDLFVPNVSNILIDYFADTHTMKIVDQTVRDVKMYPELAGVHGPIAPLLLDEFRGGEMQWLYAVPK